MWMGLEAIRLSEVSQTEKDKYYMISLNTADGECNHEIERRLLLKRKAMTNLNSILKSRDTTLPTKVHGQEYWSGLPFPSPRHESEK